MKPLSEVTEVLKTPVLIRISVLLFASFAAFLLGKHWSDGNYAQLLFYSFQWENPNNSNSSFVAISPNADLSVNISSIVSNQTLNYPPPPSHPPPPLPPATYGIIDRNGGMSDDFEVGEFDPDVPENNSKAVEKVEDKEGAKIRVPVGRFRVCDASKREYIPCMDNVEAIKKMKSTERGERFERHCPEEGKVLDCLVPAPKDYKGPIPWPRSRDEVWFSNVPHTRLVEDKGGQNWITRDGDKFKFPGGGTQFIHGADKYLDQISEMVPNIAFGKHTRVALDIGCGVASFGAFLLSRDVITLSIAPKDVHENQIQFALERGVPAMVAAFATHRLLYPSQAFDIIHCSRCRINWTKDDGILLLEVNRMLRAGGYFAWAAQPVYKHVELQQEVWKEMEDLTARMCWELVKKEGYIAIWQKPLTNICYINRDPEVHPPLCDAEDDPNNVWYVDLKACISKIPENGNGANLTAWPARLHEPPKRLQGVEMDAYIAKNELFHAESNFWNENVEGYIQVFRWKTLRLRNVMDMRAGFGGFAAALNDQGMNSWVMNVVPVSGPNTLPVIYDRGLIGVSHDWCEPFDTYPRTYDLLHASGLFSIEQKRCNISVILLEMDRMLRPGGHVYIDDSVAVIEEIKEITEAMGWMVVLRDTSEGPYSSKRLLTCEK